MKIGGDNPPDHINDMTNARSTLFIVPSFHSSQFIQLQKYKLILHHPNIFPIIQMT